MASMMAYSMLRARVGAYTERIRAALRDTLAEEHTPREIAGSFGLGTFITMLPTLGVGVLVFLVLAYVSDRISKLALFASVVVFNPVVKWGVYVASFTLGVVLLGPVEGVSVADASLDAGPDVIVRLLVGNTLLAIVAAVVGYLVVYRLAVAYELSKVGEIVDETIEEIAEEALDD
jgi:uncharacterized protein (DUF2062 family)